MSLLKMAVEEGRRLQKEQTGFIHYCYQSKDLITHDAIPVLENGLMALALLRMHTVDEFLEGKRGIERLLPFEVEGNFPVYVHEFPKTEDPYRGLKMAPIFFWILEEVGHLIKELKTAIEAVLQRIILRAKELKDPPLWVELRLQILEGKEISSSLLSCDSEDFISLQIAEKKGLAVEECFQLLSKKWHPSLALYIGKAKMRFQEGFSPKVTPFDLYLAQQAGYFSSRLKRSHPVHLYGALGRKITSCDLQFATASSPYIHFAAEEDLPFWISLGEDLVFCFAKQKTEVTWLSEELFITLPAETEEGDDVHEIVFFLNQEPKTEIYVEGEKATIFTLGEKVTIVSSKGTITLCFSLEEGRGEFLGHIAKGNRPHQLWTKGENRFFAFDWKIFLRTLTREGSVTIRAQIQLQMPQNQERLPWHASHCLHTESLL